MLTLHFFLQSSQNLAYKKFNSCSLYSFAISQILTVVTYIIVSDSITWCLSGKDAVLVKILLRM